jgi:hypothetical protein
LREKIRRAEKVRNVCVPSQEISAAMRGICLPLGDYSSTGVKKVSETVKGDVVPAP